MLPCVYVECWRAEKSQYLLREAHYKASTEEVRSLDEVNFFLLKYSTLKALIYGSICMQSKRKRCRIDFIFHVQHFILVGMKFFDETGCVDKEKPETTLGATDFW